MCKESRRREIERQLEIEEITLIYLSIKRMLSFKLYTNEWVRMALIRYEKHMEEEEREKRRTQFPNK